MPIVRGVPTWVEAVVTMGLAAIWLGLYLCLKPFTGRGAAALVFSPILLPLLIVIGREMGGGSATLLIGTTVGHRHVP